MVLKLFLLERLHFFTGAPLLHSFHFHKVTLPSVSLSSYKSFMMSISPVVAGDVGYSTSPCKPLQGGSALHSFDGTSHPGNS